MNNMLISVNTVLVVFLVIAVGYIARRVLKYKKEDVLKINKLEYYFLLPIMLFSNTYKAEMKGAVSAGVVIYVLGGVFVTFLASFFIIKKMEKQNSMRGVMIQASFRSNFLILGIPLMQNLFPDSELFIVSALTAFLTPLLSILAVISLEWFHSSSIDLKRIIINILKNPLIIATVAGIVFNLAGIRLPSILDKSLTQVGGIASTLGLIILGAQFEYKSIKNEWKQLIYIVTTRLLIVPFIYLSLAFMLGFRGTSFAVMIPAFASPVAVASYSVAVELGGDSDLAANAIAVTTAASVGTLIFWIYYFKSLGAF